MSRNTKIVIGGIALLAVILGLLWCLSAMRIGNQTASAMATVAEVKREAKSGTDDTIVTLSYQAGAATAQGKVRVRGLHLEDYPVGRQVRICYDPANLKSVRIDDKPCS